MTLAQRQVILHIDMDAFYASVEQRENPKLQGKPVLVGASAEQRGVVAACSYEARRFGIHSAMPMSQALRRCPHAVTLPVRMARYVAVSRQIHQIFQHYTPAIEPVSVDEAFLDIAPCRQLWGHAEALGRKIKQEIKQETDLTASVGVAPNKFLAKLASALEKPDAFVVITDRNKQEILDPLSVSKIWGIGKVTHTALKKMGIHTIKQLRTTPRQSLSLIFKNHAAQMLELAQGIDPRCVQTVHETKSISSEETFARDIGDRETLLAILQNQVEEVSQRLRAAHLQARTITLKLRNGHFRTMTRSATLAQHTHTTKRLWEEGKQLFSQWYNRSAEPLRLLGLGTSNLQTEDSGQLSLFPDPEEEKQKKLDGVVDQIKVKYGDDALRRGGQQV